MKTLLDIAALGVLLSICACTEGGSASGQDDPQSQDQTPKPEIVNFAIDKPRVKANTTVRFSWKSKNTETCLLKNQRNTVLADRSEGSFDTVLKTSEMFTLWCHNGSQSSERTLQAVAENDSGLRLVNQELNGNPNLWNLDYIDGRSDGKFVTQGSGLGVRLYVVDDGIFGFHSEFEDRVKEGINIAGDAIEKTGDIGYPKKGWIDSINKQEWSNSHGTHVAGIAGGKTFGIAKDLEIIPVRIISGDKRGPADDKEALIYNKMLLDSLRYIYESEKNQNSGRAIVNISLLLKRVMWSEEMDSYITLPSYAILNDTTKGFVGVFDEDISAAIRDLVSIDVVVITAAGNGGCGIGPSPFGYTVQYTPQFLAKSTNGLLNVGNIGFDKEGVFANTTDVMPEYWLPGTKILSASGQIDEQGRAKYSEEIETGTSMSAPLLAGLTAILLERNPLLSASATEDFLKQRSEKKSRLRHLYLGNESQSGSCRKIENTDVFLPKVNGN